MRETHGWASKSLSIAREHVRLSFGLILVVLCRSVSKLSIDVLTYLMEALPIRMAEKKREKDEIYIKVALMPCKNLQQKYKMGKNSGSKREK